MRKCGFVVLFVMRSRRYFVLFVGTFVLTLRYAVRSALLCRNNCVYFVYYMYYMYQLYVHYNTTHVVVLMTTQSYIFTFIHETLLFHSLCAVLLSLYAYHFICLE